MLAVGNINISTSTQTPRGPGRTAVNILVCPWGLHSGRFFVTLITHSRRCVLESEALHVAVPWSRGSKRNIQKNLLASSLQGFVGEGRSVFLHFHYKRVIRIKCKVQHKVFGLRLKRNFLMLLLVMGTKAHWPPRLPHLQQDARLQWPYLSSGCLTWPNDKWQDSSYVPTT